MPRMTLRAAAMSLLFAAWSLPAAKADDRPAISRFPSFSKGSEQTESAKPARKFSLFGKKDEPATQAPAAPKKAEPARKTEVAAKPTALSKLKHAVGLDGKDEKSNVAQVSHQTSQKPPVQRTAMSDSAIKARTAAYNDGDALPAPADPVAPPAPVQAPVTGPSYQNLPVPSYAAGQPITPGYPYLNAPLNPCPIPNVPYQVGSTIITNQALYPQEMQYPHEYRAMYPPFYYKVRGGWMVTPWGVWSHDRWELQGTEVKVKYRSHYSIQSMFTPPHIK